MLKTNILLVLLASLQLGCNIKDIEEYDINPVISTAIMSASKTNSAINLELCDKTTFKWNSLIIVPPYSPLSVLREVELENIAALRKLMPGSTVDEGTCVLLFIENKTIVRYSLAPTKDLDFNQLVGPEPLLQIPKDMACKKLTVKQLDDRFKLSFYGNY